MTSMDAWEAAADARLELREDEGKPFTGILTGNTDADEVIRGMVTSGGEPWDSGVEAMYEANDNTVSLPANPADAEFKPAMQDAVNSVLERQRPRPRRRSPRRRRPHRKRSTRPGRSSRAATNDRAPPSATIGGGQQQRHSIPPEVRERNRRRASRRNVLSALLFLSPWIVGFLDLHGLADDLQRLPVAHRLRRDQRPGVRRVRELRRAGSRTRRCGSRSATRRSSRSCRCRCTSSSRSRSRCSSIEPAARRGSSGRSSSCRR